MLGTRTFHIRKIAEIPDSCNNPYIQLDRSFSFMFVHFFPLLNIYSFDSESSFVRTQLCCRRKHSVLAFTVGQLILHTTVIFSRRPTHSAVAATFVFIDALFISLLKFSMVLPTFRVYPFIRPLSPECVHLVYLITVNTLRTRFGLLNDRLVVELC